MRRLEKALIICVASFLLFSIVSSTFPLGGEAIQKAEVEEENRGIILHYSFEKPLIESGFREPYKAIAIPGLSNYAPPGEPLVPFKTAKILIPYSEEVQDIQVIPVNKVHLGEFYLQPAQKPFPLSYRGKIEETLPKETIYNSMKPYPENIYSKVSVQWKRGYQILILNLYPVEYIPKYMDLSYFKNFKVIVRTKQAETINELYRGLPQDREDVFRIVDNPKEADSYPSKGLQSSIEKINIESLYPTSVAKIDKKLLDIIDKYAGSYYNPEWNLTLDQYKAWVATIAWGEGGIGGYTAHSQGAPGSDVFNHTSVGNKFRFSTGIGPFQMDVHGSKWPTINKLNVTKALIEEENNDGVLTWHNKTFGKDNTLADFSERSHWNAVKPDKIETRWKQVTGTNWNDHNNGRNESLSWTGVRARIEMDNPTYYYENNVKKVGKVKWNITEQNNIRTDTNKIVTFEGYWDTWLIYSRDWGGNKLFDYYYTNNPSAGYEIWVWNNSDDQANGFRYIFVREYSTGRWPENISGDKAGYTLTKPALEPPAEYVIITNEHLKNAPGPYNFQKLAEWKESRGIRTKIVTVEEIYANYSGKDNQTKIRNFIRGAYLNGTNYIFLGGDADGADVGGESGDDIVPVRTLWACGLEPAPPNISSDLYYACLDGSYDSNGNGIYGELDDGGDWPGAVGKDVDLDAEVYVGRAPVDSYEELSNFVRKTISYENCSINDPYLRDAWMVGELLWDGCPVEEAIYKTNVNNPEEILNSLRKFRDENLKTKYVELYYEYSPDVRRILIEEPDLLMKSAGLIVKYMPPVRYMRGDENSKDLAISEKDVEQVVSFIQRLKSEVEERREEIGIERSYELIKLLGEFEEQFSKSKGKTFGQALRSSVYFDSEGAEYAERLGKTWGGDYKDEIKNGTCSHGYCTKGFPTTYNVSTLYDRDYPGHDWPKSEIIDIINNNTHIINHLGHGGVCTVMKMDNDDVDALTNNKYFFGYSQACYAGSFDNQDKGGVYIPCDCIVEHFVTNTSGAYGFIANSRYGFGERGSTKGPSQYYDRQFWDAVFGEGITNVGVANQDSKEDNIGLISDKYMRFCYYEINLLGDPETPIFLLKPEHDIQVKDMIAPEKIVAGKLASINATIENIGKNDESNIEVQLLENDTIKNVTTIESLSSGNWIDVSFCWTSIVTGDYMLKIYAVPVIGENSINNNYEQKMVRVSSALFTDNYTDFGDDTDGDGLYNYLVINVGVDVATAGTYKVRGEIYERGAEKTVAYAFNRTNLSEGEQIVQLKFDGRKIRENKYNGTYDLKNLELYKYKYKIIGEKREKIDYRDYAYTTNYYNWTDFQKRPGGCAVEEAAYKGNINNSEEVLNSLREFRDEALKTKYVKLYYEYNPEVKEVLIEEPSLLMDTAKLIAKYIPAVRYVIEKGGEDLKITENDTEQVMLFTEKLKEEIRAREEKIGLERSSDLIKLLEEFEEQWNASVGMNFSKALESSVYFESNPSKSSEEGVIYVPDNYSIIQDAIDDANVNDKIIVRDGTYAENILIDKPLTIESENGSASTIIQAEDSTRPAFKLIGYNTNISGFTITGVTNYEAGISFIGAYLCNISNNNLSDNDYGIKIRYLSNNNTLSNNIVSNSGIGIHIQSSDNNTLTNNTVSNSGFGIRIFSAINNTIYLNNFINNIQNAFSLNSANTWNSTKKINYIYHSINYTNYLGNYWDDYTGSDTNNDGIGDTFSYNIDSDKDDYPLMQPWEDYFAPTENIFDAGAPANPYPSIFGTHNGTIKPSNDITVHRLYTYPCPGTGGHSEYVKIWNNSGWNVTATWGGYKGEWHNITFNETFVLHQGELYNYTIRTGSYPQIHHTDEREAEGGMGIINCISFVDANGKVYNDWIPAIRLWAE